MLINLNDESKQTQLDNVTAKTMITYGYVTDTRHTSLKTIHTNLQINLTIDTKKVIVDYYTLSRIKNRLFIY